MTKAARDCGIRDRKFVGVTRLYITALTYIVDQYSNFFI